MSLLFLLLAPGAAVAGPSDPVGNTYRFAIQNSCHEDLRFAVLFRDGRAWRSRGTWPVSPQTVTHTDILTDNPRVFVFAWSASHTWEGTDPVGRAPIVLEQAFDIPLESVPPGAEYRNFVQVDLNPPPGSDMTTHNLSCGAPPEPAPVLSRLDQVYLDGNHPLSQACHTGNTPTANARFCVGYFLDRNEGPGEAAACNQLRLKRRDPCWRQAYRYRNVATTYIDACVATFGDDAKALDCIKALRTSTRSAQPTVSQCVEAYGNGRVDQCLERATTYQGDPAPAIRSCGKWFPERAGACIPRFEKARAPKEAATQRCAEVFGGDDEGLDCMAVLRPERDALGACAGVFTEADDRLECLRLAERQDGIDHIPGCKDAGKIGAQLRCVRDGAK